MSRQQTSARRRAARPLVEGLESRALLSGMPAPHPAILPQLANAAMVTTSTVPANGDVNPYGVAFVPAGFARGGPLHPGDVLVSNFNASSNLQGTGTTIVRITPGGQQSVFYQAPQGVGLSTALGILKQGYVLVGNLPTTDGTAATAGQGSLIVLDRNGQKVAEFSSAALLNGPWDMTTYESGDNAHIFISNVLSGTVSRFDVHFDRHGIEFKGAAQIASGYTHRPDPAAFEVGPTGLAYDARHDVLFVASTADNAVYAIRNAGKTKRDGGTGRVAYRDDAHLHGPLGLTLAPNGNLIVANSDVINADPNQTSELVEFTPFGRYVAEYSLSPNAGGSFGLATQPIRGGAILAAVNDATNSLEVWQVRLGPPPRRS